MNDNLLQTNFASKNPLKASYLISNQSDGVQAVLDDLGVKIIVIPSRTDDRGLLGFLEFDSDLPFSPQRIFVISEVPEGKTRGEHAHHKCEQILICLSGTCEVEIDSSTAKLTVVLDSPNVGIYLPPLTWARLNLKSQTTAVLVLASLKYDELDYVRDYDEFLEIKIGTKE